jgi:hypothetical protein
MAPPTPHVRLFWQVADPLIAAGHAEQGTMMGHPCLRVDGAFFATAGHDDEELIVKLPVTRVEELIAAGTGRPFAPAGRRFKEWVAIVDHDPDLWQHLVHEARAFVAGNH